MDGIPPEIRISIADEDVAARNVLKRVSNGLDLIRMNP